MNRSAKSHRAGPWPWIAIAALAILPHLGMLSNPFVFDDWNNVPDNPYMVHPHALQRMFSGNVWDFLGRVGIGNYYRPMMHLFHYLVYHLLGHDAGWFHLACLLLHAGVSVMAAVVVRRLSGRQAVGILAGLLFAVHPVHTEVVAWISCSPELLSSLFSLTAIELYFRAGCTGDRRRGDWSPPVGRICDPGRVAAATVAPTWAARFSVRRALLAAAIGVCVLLAALSKEIGVMAPALVIFYETGRRGDRRRRPLDQLRARWPEYTAMAAAIAAYLAARVWALGGLVPVHRRGGLPLSQHLWTSLALFWRFLVVLVWPLHLNFFRYYQPNRGPFEPVVLAGWLSFIAFCALGIWLYRRRSPALLALPMYALWLLPVFQLPYIFTRLLMIERAAYLPSVGFCWLAAAGLVKLAEARSKVQGPRSKVQAGAGVFIAVVLVFYTARSAARMSEWHDEVELTREGLAWAPWSFHMHLVRGEALLRHDRPAEAATELGESIRLLPDYADAHNDLGRACLALGKASEAIQEYRRAAELSLRDGRPDSASRAFSNMGVAYRSVERNREAIAAYREALRLDPEFSAARNNLGFALLLEGRVQEAIGELATAARQDPALALARSNLGLAYAMAGRFELASRALAEAERLDPNNAETQARLGEVYLAQGQFELARRRFLRALGLQPANARARQGLAAIP